MASSSENKQHSYSRKQKSLGLLSSNFLKMYDREGVESVGLDEAAACLGVERRRIYDIVNVLESVGVLSRKAKNRYSWKGFDGIPKALDDLHKEASNENCGSAIVSSNSCKRDLFDDTENEKILDSGGEETSQASSSSSYALTEASLSKGKTDNRREKSLALLTRSFVKLFLATNVDIISLDEAARLLLGDACGSLTMKTTKVRRLYDIANVLSSLNLIEKTHQMETRKPAFKWLGYNGKLDNDVKFSSESTHVEQFKRRGFGTNLTNLDFAKRRRLDSLNDDKQSKLQMKKEDLSSVQRHIHQMQERHQQQSSSKGYDFGPFQPVSQHTKKKNLRIEHENVEALETFSPHYQNQALSEIFAHYVEAWKSWYMEVAQVNKLLQKNNTIQQPS